LGSTTVGDVGDRDLQLPLCRNAVVESGENNIWGYLAKNPKIYLF
jgi:hypothetical protein